MRFSHSLQFNSVPDWADHYFAYSNLKKLVYQLEKEKVSGTLTRQIHDEERQELVTDERTTLLNGRDQCDRRFKLALDKELAKIVAFYEKKEKELSQEVNSLESDMHRLESEDLLNDSFYSEHTDDADEEGDPHIRQQLRRTVSSATRRSRRRRSRNSISSITGMRPDFIPHRESFIEGSDPALPPSIITKNLDGHGHGADTSSIYSQSSYLQHDLKAETKLLLKRRNIDLFVLLSELKSYLNLNLTAFSKILKKYDKITGSDFKRVYIPEAVLKSHPFLQTTRQELNDQLQRVEKIYANICTDDDLILAQRELKTYLREHVVWERNTVWRDMIAAERKQQSLGVGSRDPVSKEGHERLWGLTQIERRAILITIACISVFTALLILPVFDGVEENNCFALLVFASLLWATEVIPLFTTSLLIPLLVVTLRVMRDTDESLPAPVRLSAMLATKKIFSTMFSPVIMLLLGGFTIAAALSKHHIAKMLAQVVLSRAGTRPSHVLLANIAVATIASMWISNVAAPVLCFSLVQPILRTLPVGSPFAKCLILGIALASNVGGMASPISSPQNIIAIENMTPSPSWLEWFFIALPVCIICDFIIWLLLLWSYQPERHTHAINLIRAGRDPITSTQIFVGFVTILTIVFWCLEHQMAGFWGDMGIIAIIPMVVFFGTGILTKEDFNNFLWTVIVLAMGGIALGKAVESSGLLSTIATHVKSFVNEMSVFEILFIFSSLVLVIATFVSHTVAALIVLPIVREVGEGLADPHPRLLVMGAALMCSAAMGLPVSGFPNMNAIMLEDEMGIRYLSVKDFLFNGIPGSILAMIIITTVGYGLLVLVGF